jgi:hypothetical protein
MSYAMGIQSDSSPSGQSVLEPEIERLPEFWEDYGFARTQQAKTDYGLAERSGRPPDCW